jgi:putative oxidoreductase
MATRKSVTTHKAIPAWKFPPATLASTVHTATPSESSLSPIRPRSRYLIPALGKVYARLDGFAYPITRFIVGIVFIPHGMQKLFGVFGGGGIAGTTAFFQKLGLEPAMSLAYLVGIQEFLGGICIAVGLFTRFWAAGAIILLFTVIAKAEAIPQFQWFKSQYVVLWLVLCIVVLIKGGGSFSVDRRLPKEL